MTETHSPLRFVSAAALFDGHDVSINIIRRILQEKGVEVIHLGHNRSAQDIAKAALEEDAQGVAISSYQGGHNEFFPYVVQLLQENGGKEIKVFGGGGGVIIPKEIEALHRAGVEHIYSPADGMQLGLEGIIEDMIKRAQKSKQQKSDVESLLVKKEKSHSDIAKILSAIENKEIEASNFSVASKSKKEDCRVLGITGTGGAGKSSLLDELLLRFLRFYPEIHLAVLCVDPSSKLRKGALLGDRIRVGAAASERIYFRSLATRESQTEISQATSEMISFLKASQLFDLIIVETSGIGQVSNEITSISDKSLYVMTSEFGAPTQLEKIEMLSSADFIVINKFERERSEDALRDVRKQYRRNKKMFSLEIKDNDLPIFGTCAGQFNDQGVNMLFKSIILEMLPDSFDKKSVSDLFTGEKQSSPRYLIPPSKTNYLSQVAEVCENYRKKVLASRTKIEELEAKRVLKIECSALEKELSVELELIEQYQKARESFKESYETLSGLRLPQVTLPKETLSLYGLYEFLATQNLPGFFPYAAGLFPYKRTDELPTRQFAGEGGPSRTNKRFHFLSKNETFKRLSTAFDSVTLYGEEPHERPDIFGKIGESGVSIATLDDMEELFKGIDLADKTTSVSMTINGPAAIILAMFMNAAFKQQLKGDDYHNKEKRIAIMKQVRGTVQADILKEDQAQNTCIFSLNFSLKLMGDVQEFFSKNEIKNYYTVSISGYHIAEAGANPITQLAFTLANGLTYIEYYLSRGLDIDSICNNLSFFFSNGLDAEYSVLGRVARKIWAITMRDKYGASERSQRLKYHVQTSGRSLHAQEIDFNDIRTTLQALTALQENCNSLHTNAYDEAITTPTEESVRRALAIQLILNREFGPLKTDNIMQGSFYYDLLAELVEEAVLKEFHRLSSRGGVLGAMEGLYQRGKIQDESHHYESLKDSGDLPIIGVNTFIAPDVHEQMKEEIDLSRSSYEEKNQQLQRLNDFKKRHQKHSQEALHKLAQVVLSEGNIFEELLETVEHCSLGEITHCLNSLGGIYRRGV